uniref:Tumor necrosis factor receptor superfamily member 4 n=1 Tax=Jaculus jaculus TaxID=51337 RepID=A0A8C5P3P5_JACJA|nr:tumor necrosis factor receptor superfamily member 4 [Jaculus jaculus]
MCVGAQQSAALLLLGLMLAAAARLNCIGNTYSNGYRCCRECQPGNWLVSRCDHTQDTVCQPCAPGFYNNAVNYNSCKQCTQCNQGSGSEVKQKCTPTQDTVCLCGPGTQPRQDSNHKPGVDCVPCPPGHFSPGNNQPCKPWNNCTLSGKRTQRPASTSWDAVCEERSPPTTVSSETEGPTARPTTSQSTTVWSKTSQGSSTPPLEVPRGPVLSALLGLGLGLLVPLTTLLVLYLLRKTWGWPHAPKVPGRNSFRTPIQEEQADTHFTLAKI